MLFAPPPIDGVFDSPEPGGRAGEDATSPRHTTTELERQLAEYRRTEEALARRTAELEEARSFSTPCSSTSRSCSSSRMPST